MTVKRRIRTLEERMGDGVLYQIEHPLGREAARKEGLDPDRVSQADAIRLEIAGNWMKKSSHGEREYDPALAAKIKIYEDNERARVKAIEARLPPGKTYHNYIMDHVAGKPTDYLLEVDDLSVS